MRRYHFRRKFQPTNHNGYIALQALRDAPYKLHTSLSPIRRTYQHVYYIHLLIVFILNAPFGDLYRLVMLFLIPVNIT
jgi:hypothetical protein